LGMFVVSVVGMVAIVALARQWKGGLLVGNAAG
jgi:MFS transporter, PPP family, 3-phenylpropionic acid transporter